MIHKFEKFSVNISALLEHVNSDNYKEIDIERWNKELWDDDIDEDEDDDYDSKFIHPSIENWEEFTDVEMSTLILIYLKHMIM